MISINFKRIAFGLLTLSGVLLLLPGCDNEDIGGVPSITNVRLLDPTKADSSLSAAEPGNLIVIQGNNLGGALQVFFNDFEATFNSALASNSNIVIEIPAEAPTKAVDAGVPDEIRVLTKSGEARYNFVLTAPQPVISGLYSEFIRANGTVVVNGNYFYNISAVSIGNVDLPILSRTVTQITAQMPSTAIVGALTVVGEFGSAVTPFKVNDIEGHMVNFDVPATSWGSEVCWGGAPIIPATDPDAISGKFSRIKETDLPATGYADAWIFSTCYFEFNLPAGPAADRLFKFEHNIAEPWKAGKYDITITANGTEYNYSFMPWNSTQYAATGYQTNGWRTAVIELTEFRSSGGSTIANVAQITDLKVLFNTPDTTIDSFNGSVDNFRIVKK